MILFISNHGESLPIARRLLEQGTDCGVYVHDPAHKTAYAGIMEKVPLVDLKAAIAACETIVFDGIRRNEGTREDKLLLKLFNLPAQSTGVFGPLASKLRPHHNVIGCSLNTELLQLTIPMPHEFSMFHEGWFNGEEWVFFSEILEDVNFMNADYGLMLGCQQTTVTVLPGQPEPFKDIGKELKKNGYKGPVACDYKGNVAGVGFRFDSLYALLTLLDDPLAGFLEDGFTSSFCDGFAASERITVPPYPYKVPELLDMAKDVQINELGRDIWFQDILNDHNTFMCAGNDGACRHHGRIAAATDLSARAERQCSVCTARAID